MPADTPHKYKSKVEVDIRTLSYADLYMMYQLVVTDKNHIKGQKGSAVVSKRFSEVVRELNNRTYGLDPYELDKVPIHGQDPMKIDLDDYDKQEGNNKPDA